MPRSLDLVVTSVATQLMEATASTATQVSQKVLAQLVEQFDVDASFLRHRDQLSGALVLVAEWPPRIDIPGPDPTAVVQLTGADPLLTQFDQGRKPVVISPGQPRRSGWRGLAGSKQPSTPSVAAAPLVSGEITTGLLGFAKFGARKWKQAEINTLEAVAALFAQLQARIAAEEKLRYLAEHDDLTGLYNRRALVAHLSERLAAGKPGPVAVLYLDLDRLKPINDYLGHTAGDWFIRVFAQRIQVCAGDQAMIARLGGDEFVVVPDQSMSPETAESFPSLVEDAVRAAGHRWPHDQPHRQHRAGGRYAGARQLHRSAAPCRRGRADRQARRRQPDRGLHRRHVIEKRLPQRH
jgi:GGDEF domain-containing protein